MMPKLYWQAVIEFNRNYESPGREEVLLALNLNPALQADQKAGDYEMERALER